MVYVSDYWSDAGKYSKEWDALYDKLVKPSGKSTTIAGEAIRATSRLIHECYNNGWGNNVSGAYFYLRNFFDKYEVDFDEFSYFEDPSFDGRFQDEEKEGELIDQMVDNVYTVITKTYPSLQTTKNSKDMWDYNQATPTREYTDDSNDESESGSESDSDSDDEM